MQEIWVGVVQGIGRLRDATKLRSWLLGIAHRTLINRLRARYAMPLAAHAEVGEIAMQDFASDREEAQAAVKRGLALLPVPERDALTLFYLQGIQLPGGEIGAETGIRVLNPTFARNRSGDRTPYEMSGLADDQRQ